MTKKQTTVKLDEEQYQELARVREETGVPISESLRRAVREWLDRRKEKREGKQ